MEEEFLIIFILILNTLKLQKVVVIRFFLSFTPTGLSVKQHFFSLNLRFGSCMYR